MNSALVKIDVAEHITGKPVHVLYEMADGLSLLDGSLMWVWDFALGEEKRDLRLWVNELEDVRGALLEGRARSQRIASFEIAEVIAWILPPRRVNFAAGEVSRIFQVRPNTRRDLLDSAGLMAGRNFYSRQTLATFLKARWLHSSRRALQAEVAA